MVVSSNTWGLGGSIEIEIPDGHGQAIPATNINEQKSQSRLQRMRNRESILKIFLSVAIAITLPVSRISHVGQAMNTGPAVPYNYC
jgi:hypothetical protein